MTNTSQSDVTTVIGTVGATLVGRLIDYLEAAIESRRLLLRRLVVLRLWRLLLLLSIAAVGAIGGCRLLTCWYTSCGY